jgi:hypothetical protein
MTMRWTIALALIPTTTAWAEDLRRKSKSARRESKTTGYFRCWLVELRFVEGVRKAQVMPKQQDC